MASNLRAILITAAAMLLASGLSGCREEEQGRPLTYEKGVYGGQQDEPLSEETARQLHQRGQLQKF